MHNPKSHSISTFLFVILTSTMAFAGPEAMTVSGRIMKTDGTPLVSNSVAFSLAMTDPSENCVVYEEQINSVDMSNARGDFEVFLGTGSRSFPASGTFTVAQGLDNSGVLNCKDGTTYTPVATDARKLKIQFYEGSAWKTFTPLLTLNAAPYAMHASTAAKLGSKVATDFILKDSVNGNANCDGGNFLTWDASTMTFGCAAGGTGGGGSLTQVTSATPFISVANSTTAPEITANVGTGPNTLAAGNDPRLSDSRTPSGSAGGDLTGSYPNPTVGKIKGFALDFTSAPQTGQVLTFDGTNFIASALPAGNVGTVTSVSSANSYLSVASGTSTPLLTLNVGTAVNTVAAGNDSRFTNARIPTGTAGGDLSNTYPNPTVAKIQGVGVDFSTLPTPGQVLTYDGSKFVAQSLPAGNTGTVSSIAVGTGLTGGPITTTGTIGLGAELSAINALSTNGYIQRTGTATYSTTAGSYLPSTNNLVMRDGSGVSSFYGLNINGSSSGAVTFLAPSIVTSYSLTWPNSQGSSNQTLVNNGSGVLTWANLPAAPASACAANNVLTYNGSTFTCVPDQTGSAGTGITSFNGSSTSSQSLGNGYAGTFPAWVTNTGTGVHTLNIPMASSVGVSAGLISASDYNVFNAKQNALGYVPLNPANNLNDVSSVSSARTNLGLGSAAVKDAPATGNASTTQVVMGDDTRLTNSRAPLGSAGGDLTGSYPNPTVSKINGVSLAISSITAGNFLRYNGTSWVNASLTASDIPNIDTNYVSIADMPAACSGADKTLNFTAPTNTWTCVSVAIPDSSVTYATRSANTVFAGPTTGVATVPTFRALVAADLPTIALTKGGTGLTAPGSGNQLLGMNSAATAAEYKTIAAGSGVTISQSANLITINATGSGGTVTSITAGTGLKVGSTPGGNITATGTLNIDAGTAASQIVQLNTSAQLPAVSGVNLTALNASNLTSGTLAAARLPASGVTANTYGSASSVPVITVDGYGRITGVVNTSISASGSGGWTAVGSDPTTMGNVSIGTTTASTIALDVRGQARTANPGGSSQNNATTTIDWNNGNSQSMSVACTSTTLNNLMDGGTYMLAVTEGSATTCTFTSGSLVFKYVPANGNRTISTSTVYTFQRIGSVVYVTWITGF